MTREVAQGNTTMARAIFLPLKSWFRTIATMKPITVDRMTTDSTQYKVLSMTVLKAGRDMASAKFLKPTKPPTRPDLDTSLKAIRKTMQIGNTTKTAISSRLGSSHTYGSILRPSLLFKLKPFSLINFLIFKVLFKTHRQRYALKRTFVGGRQALIGFYGQTCRPGYALAKGAGLCPAPGRNLCFLPAAD